MNVLASLWDGESKFQLFFLFFIFYIHCPENISAVVWFWWGEKPRTSSQKYILNLLIFVYDKLSLGDMSDFTFLFAVVPPIGRLVFLCQVLPKLSSTIWPSF